MVPGGCGQCGKGGREELLPLAVGSTSVWKRGEGAVMLRAGKEIKLGVKPGGLVS